MTEGFLQPQPTVGLVLEGGARRGIFTAGVLDCFLEAGITFPYVVGVSAGAQTAVDFLAGAKGRSRQTMTDTPGGKFPKTPDVRDRLAGYLRRLVYEYPYKQYPLDFEALFASPAVLEIVATDVETGDATYFRETSDAKRLLDMQMASSSVPILFRSGTVDGKQYVDGSIADAIPFQRAFSKGCDKVVVIMTKAKDELATDYGKMKFLVGRMYQKRNPALYEKLLNRIERYKEQRGEMYRLEQAGKLLLFQPDTILVKAFETSESKLTTAYWTGYHQAEERLEELKKFMAE